MDSRKLDRMPSLDVVSFSSSLLDGVCADGDGGGEMDDEGGLSVVLVVISYYD